MAYTTVDDPSAHFQIALHSSANAATITNDGNSDLQPDFIWSKARGSAYTHGLYDSTRGVTKFLSCDDSNAETTASAGYDLTAFNSDGFTTGNNQYNTICGGTTYVAWQWKANGGTGVTNNDGNITSTIQANPTAGFSIVTYTGQGTQTGKTVGHGLGAVPKMIISKDRGSTSNVPTWRIYHEALGNTKYMELQSGAAVSTYNDWDNTTPTSSVYSVGGAGGYTPTNTNLANYVAYVFADVQGYSRFGSYVGNGQTQEGPFVYTGFKPAFVMIKNTETASRNWYIYDIKRRAFNSNGSVLSANVANAEADDQAIDIFSNGFRVRPEGVVSGYGTSTINHNSQKFIYAAWAENPFVTSTGVPGTAL